MQRATELGMELCAQQALAASLMQEQQSLMQSIADMKSSAEANDALRHDLEQCGFAITEVSDIEMLAYFVSQQCECHDD